MTPEEKYESEVQKVLQKIKFGTYLSEVGIPIVKFHKDQNEEYEKEVLSILVGYGAIGLLDDPINKYLDKLKNRTIDSAYVYMDPGINIERYFSEEGVIFIELLENFNDVYDRYNPQSKKTELKRGSVKFEDGGTPKISVDGSECLIPKYSLEYYLCKVMFRNKPDTFVSWDEVFIEVDGDSIEHDEDKSASLYDAVRRLNRRIQQEFATNNELMTWQKKNIKRNF